MDEVINKSPFFSVIIPIYNVEKYLKKCVNSIVNQVFSDFEIILVDDGSPDGSAVICDEYASKFSNIIVIHKNNGGASDARNIGVENAKGKYIVFLDGDDYWYGNNCLSEVHAILNKSIVDVLIFESTDVYGNKLKEINSRGAFDLVEINKGKDLAIKSLIMRNQFPGAAWQFFVERKFLLENNIQFIKGIKAEDIDWVLSVFYKAKNITAISKNFHRYLKNRDSSITSTADRKSLEDVLFSVDKWYSILKNDGNKFAEYLLSYLAFQYLTTYIVFAKLSNREQDELLPKLERYRSILNYSLDSRSKKMNKLIGIIGVFRTSKIILFVYKLLQKIPRLRSVR